MGATLAEVIQIHHPAPQELSPQQQTPTLSQVPGMVNLLVVTEETQQTLTLQRVLGMVSLLVVTEETQQTPTLSRVLGMGDLLGQNAPV